MAYAGGRRWPDLGTNSHKHIVQDFVPSSGWTEDAKGHYLFVDLPDFKKDQVKLHVDNSGQITISGERLTSDRSSIKRFEQTFKLPPNLDIDQISGKFEGEILHVTVPKRIVEKQREPAKREAETISSSSNITEEIKQESSLNNKDENVNKDNAGAPNHNEENVKKDNAGEEDHHHGHICQSEKKEKNSRVDSFDKEVIEKWSKEPTQLEWAMKILRRNKDIVLTAIIAFSLGVFVSRKLGPATTHEAAPLN